MIDINNISPLQSDFEQIKKLEEDGQEYWTSRELCNALGYSTYQKFTRILNIIFSDWIYTHTFVLNLTEKQEFYRTIYKI